MRTQHIAAILIFLSSGLFTASPGSADRIVLKDGTVEESEKIWVSDKFIHFILQGTQSVEIRYAMEIVERIERDDPDGNAAARQQDPNSDTAPLSDRTESAPKDASIRRKNAGVGDRDRLKDTNALRQALSRTGRGDSFYNPRRSLRYRVSKASAYNDLDSALKELGEIYDRSAEWVAEHMGEENNIYEIHQNLTARKETELKADATQGGNRQALPDDSGTVPEKGAKTAAEHSASPRRRTTEDHPFPELTFGKNTKFYDPRRSKKYWTDRLAHHSSLHDAVEALARQYDVSSRWIEEHMGDSNLLIDIHHNIRGRLR